MENVEGICESCGKNPATVHVTQISQDESVVFHLCETCAAQKGIQITIQDEPIEPAVQPQLAALSCPRCGTTSSTIKKEGRAGCSHCYVVFNNEFTRILRQIHGTSRHKGKKRGDMLTISYNLNDINKLKDDLKAAVQSENFEEAALLRDEIKTLIAGER